MMATEGHRHRLRKRYLAGRDELSEVELLELLLTYAIPRKDVAPLAVELLKAYSSIEQLLSVSHEELLEQDGIGETTVVLLGIVQELVHRTGEVRAQHVSPQEASTMEMHQQELFGPSLQTGVERDQAPKPPPPPPTRSDIRAYTNDLSKVALEYLPSVVEYDSFADFSSYLEENLPYNSATTRNRYTRYLTNRYYPEGTIATSLTDFLAFSPDTMTQKAILFYETVRAEPAVRFMAEHIVWPALPIGYLERSTLAEKLQKRFAEASDATIKRMIYSLVNLYTLLDVAVLEDERLVFPNQIGTLPAFVYILAAEFPDPGIYAFELLEKGPIRRWLLWDKEWIRRQLYNLRDLDIIAKISEIDAIRQFTLSTTRQPTMRRYFEHPRREALALREAPAFHEDQS